MSASSICFDEGGWVCFADVEGNTHSGVIVSGGVEGDDGKRSDVTIALADETFVVPAPNVFDNVEDPQVAAALAQAQQEEEEEAAYAEEAEASVAPEASESADETILSAEEKAQFGKYELPGLTLAAARFKAQIVGDPNGAAPDTSDSDESKAASDDEEKQQQQVPTPVPTPMTTPVAASEPEAEAEPEENGAESPAPEPDPDPTPEPETTPEEVAAATVATLAPVAAGEMAHAPLAPPEEDVAWFESALAIMCNAPTLTDAQKAYAAQVVEKYRHLRNGGATVEQCAPLAWKPLREQINCEATWALISEPPFEVAPAQAEPAPPPPAEPAPAEPAPAAKAPRKKRQAKPQAPASKKSKTEAPVEPPFEPADVDKDEYEVSTVETTVTHILVASKLDGYRNYSPKYSLCPDKTSDPLIDAMDGSTALQKLRAFVRKQNVESLTSPRAVCITARMLYLVMVSKNSKYTDLKSALTYIKSSQDNSPEVITFLCLRVLNKINGQNEVNSFGRLMYTMLANLAATVL